MDTGLAGRGALVGGGSSGLGKAIAEALSDEGCRLAIWARGADRLAAVADDLRARGREVYVTEADARDPECGRRIAAWAAEQLGVVDDHHQPGTDVDQLRSRALQHAEPVAGGREVLGHPTGEGTEGDAGGGPRGPHHHRGTSRGLEPVEHGRERPRLVTTNGSGTGWGTGHAHHGALMERLALLTPSAVEGVDGIARTLHRAPGAGSLIAVVGSCDQRELNTLATLERRFGFVAIARFRPTVTALASYPSTRAANVALLDVDSKARFGDVWNRAVMTWSVVGSIAGTAPAEKRALSP